MPPAPPPRMSGVTPRSSVHGPRPTPAQPRGRGGAAVASGPPSLPVVVTGTGAPSCPAVQLSPPRAFQMLQPEQPPPTSPTPAPLLPRTEQAAARAPSARAPFLPTRCQLSFLPNDICSWGQGGQGLGWAGGGPEKAVALARRAARPGNQMGKGLEAQAQSLNVQVRESGKRELPSGAGVKG